MYDNTGIIADVPSHEGWMYGEQPPGKIEREMAAWNSLE